MNKILIISLFAFSLMGCESDKKEEVVKPARSYTRNTQQFEIGAVESDTFRGKLYFKATHKDGSYDVALTLKTDKTPWFLEGVAIPKKETVNYSCDSTKLVYTISDKGVVKNTEVHGKPGETIQITMANGKIKIKFDLATNNGGKIVGEIED